MQEMQAAATAAVNSEVNRVVAVRRVVATPSGGASSRRAAEVPPPAQVEVELSSTRSFPVSGALPVLHVGDQTVRLSRLVPAKGGGHNLVFTMPDGTLAKAPAGAPLELEIGARQPWRFQAPDR